MLPDHIDIVAGVAPRHPAGSRGKTVGFGGGPQCRAQPAVDILRGDAHLAAPARLPAVDMAGDQRLEILLIGEERLILVLERL